MKNISKTSQTAGYEPAARSEGPEFTFVVDVSNNHSEVDLTKPSFLGEGKFSLFGIGFNLFGSPRKGKPTTPSAVSISTASLNSSNDGSRPKLSLSQKIKSFFFGPSTADGSSAQATKGTSLLSWFRSKMFGSAPKIITYGKDTQIPDRGSSEFSAEKNPVQINVINEKLNIADWKKANDTATFAKDAARQCSFIFTGKKGTVSSVGMPGVTETEKAARVRTAKQVIKEIALCFLPYFASKSESKASRIEYLHNLENDLMLLNSQGLSAGPTALFFSKHVPENSFFPAGGIAASFTYTKKSNQEITITAKGTLSSNNFQSTLIGKKNGETITPCSENQGTTGNIEMTIKAKVGDDGHITSLTCQSAKVSYQIHEKKSSLFSGLLQRTR